MRSWRVPALAATLVIGVAGAGYRLLHPSQQGSNRPPGEPAAAVIAAAASSASAAGEVFRDCPSLCPEMVRLPAGGFRMGSPATEAGRGADEGPEHEVRIPAAFAVSKYPITRGQWRRYLDASQRSSANYCYVLSPDTFKWGVSQAYSWSHTGFPQQDNHPVVCISWQDAQDYAGWLSRRTGHHYRLLSEAEYEYSARAGSSTAYWWGPQNKGQCSRTNASDKSAAMSQVHVTFNAPAACNDGFVFTSPVDHFAANPFGLHDITGNVWTWIQDCYHESYEGAPEDGRAWEQAGDCLRHVVRGGGWINDPPILRAAQRLPYAEPASTIGLRLARD